jgi:hypothetical protein
VGNAQRILSYRRDLPNGDIIQVVVWLLSEPLLGSAHLFKYRLHYQGNGADYVRYDNERCKGDHRHIGSMEEPYLFESVKKLVQDFYGDIKQARATGGISWIGISK